MVPELVRPVRLPRVPAMVELPVIDRPPVPWIRPVPPFTPTAVTAPLLATWNWLVVPTLNRPTGLVLPRLTPEPLSYSSELLI